MNYPGLSTARTVRSLGVCALAVLALALAFLFVSPAPEAHAVTKPAKAKITSIYSKSMSGMTVTWNEVANADGYQVRYSKKKSMSGAKKKTFSGTTGPITKLTSGKKYYVQVRAYTKSNGKKVYGSWSKKKSCSVTKISGSYLSYPSTLPLGSAFDFRAKITSNYAIKKVTGRILDANGKVVQTVTVEPNAKTYKVYNGAIDNGLSCAKLSAGTYKYQLIAYVHETHKYVVNKSFTVKAAGSPMKAGSTTTSAAITNTTVAKQIYNYCIKKGLTPAAAAAVCGNAQQESDFNSKLGSKTKGYGLFQMTDERYDNLVAYAKSVKKDKSDVTVQLDFLFMEPSGYTLNGTKYSSEWFGSYYKINGSKTTYAYWKTWKNVDMATEAFCECFERAGTPLMSNRIAYARAAYKAFAK